MTSSVLFELPEPEDELPEDELPGVEPSEVEPFGSDVISGFFCLFKPTTTHIAMTITSAAAEHIASCRRAAEAGVTLCTGTDLLPSDPIGGTNPTTREAELLVEEIGLTPLEAIKAATYNGARLCGVEKVTDSLDAGKCVDYMIVVGKPDQNIRDLRNLRLVSPGCRLAWSTLPALVKDNFKILAPGVPCEGGVFKRW